MVRAAAGGQATQKRQHGSPEGTLQDQAPPRVSGDTISDLRQAGVGGWVLNTVIIKKG